MTTTKPNFQTIAQARVILTMGEKFAVTPYGKLMAAQLAKWLDLGFLTVIRSNEQSIEVIQ